MKFLLKIVSLLIILSCTNNQKEKQLVSTKNNTDTIVFIFNKDKFKESKTWILNPSKIYYTEYASFKKKFLFPNNTIANDTLRINISFDKICLTHQYGLSSFFYYEFKKGDTIQFRYTDTGKPKATILNRKVLPFDADFELKSNLKKPKNNIEFFDKNKRYRNDNEQKKFTIEMQQFYKQYDGFLDSIYSKNLISKSIYQLQKNSYKYYRLNTGSKKDIINATNDLENDSLLFLGAYRYFLENFVNYNYNGNMPTTRFDPVKAFDYIQHSHLFKGKVRSFLLYTYIKKIAELSTSHNLTVYFKKFSNEVTDTTLVNEVKNAYLIDFSELKEKIKDVHLINLKKEKTTLDSVIKQYKGKLIYIDFWASWCAPCRDAMPASKKIASAYKNKDIVFLYISIDKDFSKWQKASQEESLFYNKNNLFAVNYPNAIFYKKLKLRTIPRYLLYNKKGELIYQNATSPKNYTELEKLIDKHLKE